MTLDPVQLNLVPRHFPEQRLPEVGIEGGLFITLDPIISAPIVDPTLFQRVNHILRIAVQIHLAVFL